MTARLRVAMGITAHNEGRNLGRLLERLRTLELREADLRIVVVASGCTDDTAAVAERAAARDGRIRLVVDPERRGKATAINQFIATSPDADIFVMESADTLPDPGAIEALVARFAEPRVGMVGARPVPEDDDSTFLGYAVQLLWRLHHAVASRSPKQGELVAWRNVVPRLPEDVAADEAYLEAEVTRAGYTLAYEPAAIVHNRGPATVGAFLLQRRRNHAIHRQLAARTEYRPATRDHLLVARLGLAELLHRPGRAHWLVGAALLEAWASALGWWDHVIARRSHTVWTIVEGTKELARTTLAERPPVAAVIVSYNSAPDVLECVASIKRNAYPVAPIIVVDNGGADRVGALLATRHPEVEVIRLETNDGLARGFNVGLRRALAAGCEYVLSLNPDVVIASDFVDHAVLAAASEPRAASVSGPVFYYDDPERLYYAGGEILWWLGKTYHRGRRVIWGPAFRVARRVGYASGAAVLYPATALRDVGEWDERYFLVFEETDWCVRATRRGWHHSYVPGPKAWHKVSASFGGEKAPLYLYFLFRNNVRFMARRARPWHWPTFLLFFAVESVGRYALTSLLARDPLRAEKAIALAVLDALGGRYGRGSYDRIARAPAAVGATAPREA